MTSLGEYLTTRGDRCPGCGYHPAHQGCACHKDEWGLFLAALRQAAKDGRIHQGDVRPLIRGRIEPKHIGQLYRRARSEGLIREAGWEQSNDTAGRNADKQQRIYEWKGKAA